MRTSTRLLVALLAIFALVAAGCGSDDDNGESADTGGSSDGTSAPEPVDGPTITIGVQDFGESLILAEVYGQALQAKGYTVEQQDLGGYRDLELAAFSSGEINLSGEYVASMLEFLNDNEGEATGDVDESLDLLRPRLAEIDLVAGTPAPGVNTNAFVITRETSDELGITSLSDLAEKGGDLRLGGPADCETNPFCLPGLQSTYGLDLSGTFRALDTGVTAEALKGSEIDVAVLFSTDGAIAANDFVLLEDDEGMLAADNIFPVFSKSLEDAYGDDLVAVLDESTLR